MIQVLMATMNRNVVEDLHLSERNIHSDVLIINQSDFSGDVTLDNNVRMISVTERGTSRSRNLALKEATGDICVIADDDIVYVDNYREIIMKTFEKYPDADMITFQIMHPDGTPFKSNYMQKACKHSVRTSLKCASIEIVFKRRSLLEKNIIVEPEFGLGSRYRIHDDVILVADAVKAGLNVYYEPVPIVIHPKESSGTMYNDLLITSKGAAFYRIFGLWAYCIDIAFAIKKRADYKSTHSFLKFLKLIFSGTTEYIKTH